MGDFEKKLVIMSGKAGRGTVLTEKNGMGIFVTLNVFSLPDLSAGEYALGVKTGETVFRREVGSLGRIKSRFSLPQGDYSSAHFVLFRTDDFEPVMYGTSDSRKMWEGNLMDGFRRNELDKKKENARQIEAAPQNFRYSERKIEDYFLDINPDTYRDTAIAQVDYYANSDGRQYYDKPDSPHNLERAYLGARFSSPYSLHRTYGAATDSSEREEATVAREAADAVRFAAEKKDIGPITVKRAGDYTVEQAVAAVRTDAGYYASVKPHLDKLFGECESFAPLSEALPGTKWVKVDYDGAGRYYVVGLIGSAPDYIAYGVPGKYGKAPQPLEGADFVPLAESGLREGDGFWVIFQSAATGREIAGRK